MSPCFLPLLKCVCTTASVMGKPDNTQTIYEKLKSQLKIAEAPCKIAGLCDDVHCPQWNLIKQKFLVNISVSLCEMTLTFSKLSRWPYSTGCSQPLTHEIPINAWYKMQGFRASAWAQEIHCYTKANMWLICETRGMITFKFCLRSFQFLPLSGPARSHAQLIRYCSFVTAFCNPSKYTKYPLASGKGAQGFNLPAI